MGGAHRRRLQVNLPQWADGPVSNIALGRLHLLVSEREQSAPICPLPGNFLLLPPPLFPPNPTPAPATEAPLHLSRSTTCTLSQDFNPSLSTLEPETTSSCYRTGTYPSELALRPSTLVSSTTSPAGSCTDSRNQLQQQCARSCHFSLPKRCFSQLLETLHRCSCCMRDPCGELLIKRCCSRPCNDLYTSPRGSKEAISAAVPLASASAAAEGLDFHVPCAAAAAFSYPCCLLFVSCSVPCRGARGEIDRHCILMNHVLKARWCARGRCGILSVSFW